MTRRTLLLSNLFLTAAVLFLLGVAAAPLLGLIPAQTFSGRPAATISLDLSDQVKALQRRGAELNAALEANVARMTELERALADSRREMRSVSEAPDPEKEVLRASIATLEQTVASLKRQSGLLTQRAEALAGARDATARERDDALARVEELKGELLTRERDAEAGRAALSAELVALREQVDARDRDLATLRQQLDDALDESAELRAANEALSGDEPSRGSVPPNTSPPGGDTGEPARRDEADRPSRVPAAPEDGLTDNPSVANGVAAYQAGDYETAYRNWRPLADAGDVRAQFHLGALYFEGRGVPRDLDLARQWLERAAANGSAAAPALLSRIEAAQGAEAR